jgi:hypothetical protein
MFIGSVSQFDLREITIKKSEVNDGTTYHTRGKNEECVEYSKNIFAKVLCE